MKTKFLNEQKPKLQNSEGMAIERIRNAFSGLKGTTTTSVVMARTIFSLGAHFELDASACEKLVKAAENFKTAYENLVKVTDVKYRKK